MPIADTKNTIDVPVEHMFPDDVKTCLANHALVQHTPEGEFILSLFEVMHPFFISAEEIEEKAKSITSVKAKCVGRFVMSDGQVDKLAMALKNNRDKYHERKQQVEQEDKHVG